MKTTLHTLSAVAALLAATATAQSTWNGGTGDYNTAGNWTPPGVPPAGTEVIINSGTATTSSNLVRGTTTTIDGGTLVLDGVRFLNAEGTTATFNMVSGSLTQNNAEYFIVGRSNTGTFNQSGGQVDVTVGRGFFLTDGHGGGQGTYNLTGGTLDIKLNKIVSDNNTNELFNFWIGRTGNANSVSDTMLVDGGDLTLDVTGPSGADRNLLIARNSTFQVDNGNVSMDNLKSVVVGMTRYNTHL